jgi:hypothetical protein
MTLCFFLSTKQQQTQIIMSSDRVIEIVDNTWPALQRAESIFGSRTDTQFRGAVAQMKKDKQRLPPKRSLT